MVTQDNLLDEFGYFDFFSENILHAAQSTAAHKYDYWFLSHTSHALIVIAEGSVHPDTAKVVLESAPDSFVKGKAQIFNLGSNKHGFTHALAVPGEYHGYLKGYNNIDRDALFLCIPIQRYEFSGHESPSEFREMNVRIVPILRWDRLPAPKTVIYFDNPRTGSGTGDSVIVRYESLVFEIENLNGVADGFVEIVNYKGDVIEVLSPTPGVYKLIRNRKGDEVMDHQSLLKNVSEFLKA